mgnify:CR=1 FL=1
MVPTRTILAPHFAFIAALVSVYSADRASAPRDPLAARASQAVALRAEEEAIELQLEDLQALDWKPGRELPDAIKGLDGKKVVIKGYMNVGTPEGAEEFQLVSDSCGCSGKVKANHFVLVRLEDETTTFNPDRLTVTGTFRVGEEEEDGFVTSLFRFESPTIE